MSVPAIGRWFRRSPSAPAPVTPRSVADVPAPGGDGDADGGADDATIGRLIDAAGALVHLYGAYAHDTDTRSAATARDLAERWRRHLTLGLDHPSTDDAVDDEEGAPRGGALAARDWEGAVRHALADRRAEHAYLSRASTELRDTVWTLVSGLHQVTVAEHAAGRESVDALTRVRATISAADPERMREVALAAVGELTGMLAAREREREERIATLGAQIASLGMALEEAKREGATDVLTELGNRRAFDHAMEHAVALHGLWRTPFSLVLMDVDGLKQVNDTFGHAAGDAALLSVSRKLSRVFLGRTDVLARIGGDEFAVLLRDTSVEDAARQASRLAALVAGTSVPMATGEEMDDDAPVLTVGVSAGVAALADGESLADWFARADGALYAAKRAGRGRVEVG